MARPLRIEYSGAIYHITSRGNAQADIYLDDSDRAMFLETLGGVIDRFHWVCHAYCLMTNHYHLVIETPEPNLSVGMRQLNGVYTQRFNRHHRCVGHVFQGRYKAILVERDAYLIELARYVVLNPVRAGMVGHVQEWPWSSYRATAGIDAAPAWLSTDWLLSQFGGQKRRSRDQYRRFLGECLARENIWDDLKQQVYFGASEFVERIKLELNRRDGLSEVPKVQWQPSAMPLYDFADKFADRREAMARAYLEGGYKMNEIARYFGVHYATVSRAVKRFGYKGA